MKLFHFILCVMAFSFSLNAVDSHQVIKYLSEKHVHGSFDDHMSYDIAKIIMKNRNLEMTCGPFSYFMIRYLTEMDIKCRFILTLTLDEWNDYNNGHSMIEVYENDHWTLYDCDLKNLFTVENKKLNALDFCKLSKTDNYNIVKFARGDIIKSCDRETWYGSLFSSEEGFRRFYGRCCQLLCIENGGYFYFTCGKSKKDRILKYPYCGPFKWLSQCDFMKKFYPEIISCEKF